MAEYTRATRHLLPALVLLLLPAIASSQTFQTIDNGTIRTAAYGSGQFGGDCSGTPSDTFAGLSYRGGSNVLCGAGLLVGTSSTNVIGINCRYDPAGCTEWSISQQWFSQPAVGPLEVGRAASFFHRGSEDVRVIFRYWFSDDDDDFEQIILVSYEITSGDAGTQIVPALWMDWDIGNAATNVANRIANRSQSVSSSTSGAAPTFGVVIPNQDGQTLRGSACAQGFDEPEAAYYTNMTTLGPENCPAGDIRGPIGARPFTVGPFGSSIETAFCLVASDSQADFEAQAAKCRFIYTTAIENGPDGLPGTHNLGIAYPNPSTGRSAITLEVAVPQQVRIALLDMLGREVASVFEGTLPADQEIEFDVDGAGLPAGSYVIRATGEHFSATRTLSLTP